MPQFLPIKHSISSINNVDRVKSVQEKKEHKSEPNDSEIRDTILGLQSGQHIPLIYVADYY